MGASVRSLPVFMDLPSGWSSDCSYWAEVTGVVETHVTSKNADPGAKLAA